MKIDNNILECEIVKEFIKKYDIPKELKIEIIITDDMEKEYNNNLQRFNKKYDYLSPIDYNGLTCVPNTIEEPIVILINYDRVEQCENNNYEVFCTIFHELIHAKDYYNYYKKYSNGVYDSSRNRYSFYGFTNWSEFNARRISYYEYCKLVHRERLNSIEELENIKNNELPNKNKLITETLTNDDNDLEDIIYELMFYLGRYSVWEELFPSEFSKGLNYPSELSKYEPLVSDLYDCLKNNSGELEEYSKIRNLLNSFKAMWVNISSCN